MGDPAAFGLGTFRRLPPRTGCCRLAVSATARATRRTTPSSRSSSRSSTAAARRPCTASPSRRAPSRSASWVTGWARPSRHLHLWHLHRLLRAGWFAHLIVERIHTRPTRTSTASSPKILTPQETDENTPAPGPITPSLKYGAGARRA